MGCYPYEMGFSYHNTLYHASGYFHTISSNKAHCHYAYSMGSIPGQKHSSRGLALSSKSFQHPGYPDHHEITE